MNIQKSYPPYMGDEPYVYFAFASSEAKEAERILAGLYNRGVRVWYCLGPGKTLRESDEQTVRIRNASMLLIYISSTGDKDDFFTANIGYFLNLGKPALLLASDRFTGGGMAFLLNSRLARLTMSDRQDIDALCGDILRSDGFSMDLIGEPQQRSRSAARTVTLAVFAVLAALIAVFAIGVSRHWFREAPSRLDTITVTDAAIEKAARYALSPDGYAALTEESVSSIRRLSLDTLPAEESELVLFENLETVAVPQDLVSGIAEDSALWSYTIVLEGDETDG